MSAKDCSDNEQARQPMQWQILRFGLVGVAATATHYVVAMLWVAWVSVWVANLLGYLFAVAISYFGHQRITFRVPSDEVSHQRQVPRFLLTSLSGLAISYAVLAIMNLWLAAPNWLSLACVVVVVPVYSYFANKHWVFRSPDLAQDKRGDNCL